jgi:hypothetical protein
MRRLLDHRRDPSVAAAVVLIADLPRGLAVNISSPGSKFCQREACTLGSMGRRSRKALRLKKSGFAR